jgi:hypothetical protein
MSIHYNGKVGIGKEPVSQLDVNGVISQNATSGLGIITTFQALPTIWMGTARFAAGVNITKMWQKMMVVTKIGTLLHITGELIFGFNPVGTLMLASNLETTFKTSGPVPNIRGTFTIDLKDMGLGDDSPPIKFEDIGKGPPNRGMGQVTDSCRVSVILNNSMLGSQRAFTDNYVVIKDGKLHIGIDASNGNPIDSTRANYTKVDMLLSIGSPYSA